METNYIKLLVELLNEKIFNLKMDNERLIKERNKACRELAALKKKMGVETPEEEE